MDHPLLSDLRQLSWGGVHVVSYPAAKEYGTVLHS